MTDHDLPGKLQQSAAQHPLRTASITAVLLGGMFLSALPQFSIGVLAPILTVELAIGEALLGAVAASLYIVAAIVARTSGRMLDGMSARAALLLLAGLGAGSLVVISASVAVPLLILGAMIGGASMGMNNPVTNRVIALHVPAGRRGVVIGVKQAGVKVAQVTAGALIPALVLTIGWRTGLGSIAVVAAAIFVVGSIAVPRGNIAFPASTAEDVASVRRSVRWLQFYSASMAVGMSSITTYLALYSVNRINLSLTQAGLVLTVFAATGMIARLMWAVIAERVGRAPIVLITLSLGGIAGLALIAVAEFGMPVWTLWAGSVLAGATIGTWNVIAQLTVVREVEPQYAATATGSVHFAFAIGMASGPPVFGIIVESTQSFLISWMVVALLCVFGFAIALREERRRAARPHSTIG